jgi:hypothetical protein
LHYHPAVFFNWELCVSRSFLLNFIILPYKCCTGAQPPLLELELHIIWDPLGVCSHEAAKAPQRTGSSHKMLVCMEHYVEILKENSFLQWWCFYFSKYWWFISFKFPSCILTQWGLGLKGLLHDIFIHMKYCTVLPYIDTE